VCPIADGLDPFDHVVYLGLCGILFHHDHHLSPPYKSMGHGYRCYHGPIKKPWIASLPTHGLVGYVTSLTVPSPQAMGRPLYNNKSKNANSEYIL
jgi:hypothetical protein